jgi:DNA-binding CsgD family transcriptional regulator
MFVGRLADEVGVPEVAQAALRAPMPAQPPQAADLLLDGLALLITEGYTMGTPILKRAVSAFLGDEISREQALRWLWLTCRGAGILWDDESWHVLATRQIELARDAGALTALPVALITRIDLHLQAGELAAAAALNDEAKAVTAATGSHLAPYGDLLLAAWQGREAEASELMEAGVADVVRRGEGLGLTAIQWGRAVLYNGLGRYADALDAAREAGEYRQELPFANWALVELIEAATRSGQAALAADALERLSETTRTSGTDWALGVEARSRALVSDGEDADRLYREAIERLGRTRVTLALARAHLVYGEWLRRQRRRLDAREQLRTAHDMLCGMGMEGFAERAARELLAAGETARERTVETGSQLTAQESQAAQLALSGLSNPEIGARLFISQRTVQYHLGKVFAKLGITSRTQLDRVLPRDPNVA